MTSMRPKNPSVPPQRGPGASSAKRPSVAPPKRPSAYPVDRRCPVHGFALSPDGSALVVGGDEDGLQHTMTAAPSFTQVATIKALCATWAKDGLYVCGDALADGFAVGFSTDGGKTLAPIMALDAACGPLECPAASSVGAHCPGEWPAVAAKIDAKSCAPDAGTSAASSGGASGGDAGGCGCGTAGAPASTLGSMVTLLATLLTRRRRRLSRAPRPAPLTCPPSSR